MIDYQYIRTCAVFKLLKNGTIKSYSGALSLLQEKHGNGKTSKCDLVLDIWLRGPLKHLKLNP